MAADGEVLSGERGPSAERILTPEVSAVDEALGGGLGVLIVVVIVLGALVPIVLRVGYGAVRRRNAAVVERTRAPVAPMASALQAGLGSMLVRLEDADDPLGIRRPVLADRAALTRATLDGLPDRASALGFIWFVRPSQPEGFAASAAFDALPSWARDAVVLLDLRRDLQLRGAAALVDTAGFYAHDRARLLAVVDRTGDAALADAVRSMLGAPAADPTDVDRILDRLDRPSTWVRILAS